MLPSTRSHQQNSRDLEAKKDVKKQRMSEKTLNTNKVSSGFDKSNHKLNEDNQKNFES